MEIVSVALPPPMFYYGRLSLIFAQICHLVNVVQFICHFTIQPVLQQLAVVCRPIGALKIKTQIWMAQ